MQPVPYSELLKGVFDAMGWETDGNGNPLASTEEWHKAKRALARAMERVWNYAFWPELRRTELRRFHPDWSQAEAVTAGTFRFYPPTRRYYQALQDNTGNAPAIVFGGEFETNLEYWALASRAVCGDRWDSTDQYAQGDVVYYATTFGYFQAHTTPPIGTVPTDTDYWGAVSNLDPVIPYARAGLNPIGRVERVFDTNPNTYEDACELPFERSHLGLQIRDSVFNEVWVRFLKRPFKWTGDIYDATKTYESVPEEDGVTVEDLTGVTTANVNTYLEFSTVADLLAYSSSLYRTAKTHNYEGTDGIDALWIRTEQTGLVDNGDSIRQTADGKWVRRWEVDIS